MSLTLASELTLVEPVETLPPRVAQVHQLDGRHLQAVAAFDHINLLDANLLVKRRAIPAWLPLAAVASVALAAVASQLMLNERLSALRRQVAQTEAQLLSQTQQLQALGARTQTAKPAEQVQALQAALAQQSARLQAFGMALPSADAGQATQVNPSQFMAGLSQLHTPGLWLTQVQLDKQQQQFRLSGRAVQASAVTAHLSAMGEHPLFKGFQVRALVLKPSESPAAEPAAHAQAGIDFELLAAPSAGGTAETRP